MSVRYQYENLLRKPVEYYSALAYLIAASITFFLPNLLLMPKAVAVTGGWVLLFRGLQRLSQGYRLHEYQRALSKLGSFKTHPKPLMEVKNAQWLGLGFAWDGRHTQRLFDLEKPENRHLLVQKTFSKKTQALINWLDKKLPHPYKQAFELPLPEGGGRPEIHAVGLWEGEQDIGIYFSNHIGHTLVLGNTRTGKTRLLEVELIQAIARKELVVLFDTKGDADLLKRAFTQNSLHLGAPFYYLNLLDVAESHVIHWNPQLINFKKVLMNEDNTEMFILRYLYLLSMLLHDMSLPLTKIEELIEEDVHFLMKALDHYLGHSDKNRSTKNINELCLEYFQSPSMHKDHYDAVCHLLQSGTNELKNIFLSNKKFIQSILHSEYFSVLLYAPEKKLIKIDEVLSTSNGVVYLGLNNKHQTYLTPLIARMIIDEMVFSISQKNMLNLPTMIADELGNVLKDQYLPTLNYIGKAGIKASLYEQHLPHASNSNTTEFVLSHFSQLIFFRLADQNVCDFLMRRQKDVHVTTTDLISGTVDNSNIASDVTFTSSTTQRQTRQKTSLLSIHDFVALPIGQAFGLLNGNELIKLRIPLVDFLEGASIPPFLGNALNKMQNQYQSVTYLNESSNPTNHKFNKGSMATQPLISNNSYSAAGLMHNSEVNFMGINENELSTPPLETDMYGGDD